MMADQDQRFDLSYTAEAATGNFEITLDKILEAHKKFAELVAGHDKPPLGILMNSQTLEDIRQWVMNDLEEAAISDQIESTLNTIKLIKDNTLPRGEVRELYISPETLEEMQVSVARQIYEPQTQYVVRLRQDQSILYSGPTESGARDYASRSEYLIGQLKLEQHRLNLNDDYFITELSLWNENDYAYLKAMPTGDLIWGGPDLPYTYFGPAGSSSGSPPWYQFPVGT